jgi:hypothetical protein
MPMRACSRVQAWVERGRTSQASECGGELRMLNECCGGASIVW